MENVRKARDQKVIISCKTEEGRKLINEKLKSVEDDINIEEAVYKSPLVVLKYVQDSNTDADVQVYEYAK